MSDISSIKRNSDLSLHTHSNHNISINKNREHTQNINTNNNNFLTAPGVFKVSQNNSFLRPLSSRNINAKYKDENNRGSRNPSQADVDLQLSINMNESIRINDDLSDKLSLKLIHGQIDDENKDFSPKSQQQNLDSNKNKTFATQFQDYKNQRKHHRDFFNSRNQQLQQQQQQSSLNEKFSPTYQGNKIIQVFPSSLENSFRKQPLGKQKIQAPNLQIALNSSKRNHQREQSIISQSSLFNPTIISDGGRIPQSELQLQHYYSSPQNAINNNMYLSQNQERGNSMIVVNEKSAQLPIQSILRQQFHNIANNPTQFNGNVHRTSIFQARQQQQKEESSSDVPSNKSQLLDDNIITMSNNQNYNLLINGLSASNSVHNHSIQTRGSPNPNKRISFLKFSNQKIFSSRRESQRNGPAQQKIIQFQNALSIVNLEDEEADLDEDLNKQRSPKKLKSPKKINSPNQQNQLQFGNYSSKSLSDSINKGNTRKAIHLKQASQSDQENLLTNQQQTFQNQQVNGQYNLMPITNNGQPLQEIQQQYSSSSQQQQQQEYISPRNAFEQQNSVAKKQDKFGFQSLRDLSGQNSNERSFLKHLDPKQRETIFFVFRDRQQHQRYSERFSSFKNGDSWYEKLGLKAEKIKERLRQQNKLINHMIQRRNKFISDQIRILEAIKKQKKLIQNQQSSEQDAKFEEEIQYDVELLKNQIEDLEDLYKEAQDLLTIFSVAIHKTESQSPNFEHTISKNFLIYLLLYIFENYLWLIITQIKKKLNLFIKFSDIHKTKQKIFLQPSNNFYQKWKKYLYVEQKIDMFDFDSESLQVYSGFCEKLREIDGSIIEYKKYLKLDQDGEQFNIRTQNLMAVMKKCEEHEKVNEKRVNQLNLYLQNDISQRLDEIQVQIDISLQVQSNIQESADRVNKLLYIKKDQLRRVDRFISDSSKKYELMIFSGSLIEDSKQLDSLSQCIKSEMMNLKEIKKETIEESSDHYSQYFLKLKQKISNRIFISLQEDKQRMQSLLDINEFLKEKILPIVENKQDILKESKVLILKLNKKNDIISDISNNSIQLYQGDSFIQPFKPTQSIVSINAGGQISQNILTRNEKSKIQLSKVQQVQQSVPILINQKLTAAKIDMIKEAAEQLDLIQQAKNELKKDYQSSVELQASISNYLEDINFVQQKIGQIIPSLVSIQTAYQQEIEKIKQIQYQVITNLRYDVFVNLKDQFQKLLKDELLPSLNNGDQLIEEYLRSFEYYDAQIEMLENMIEIQQNNLLILQGHIDARKSQQEADPAKSEVIQYMSMVQAMINDLSMTIQFQTHLKYFTIGFTSINLLKDELEFHFNKIHSIQQSYALLQKQSSSSARYTLQSQCQQINNSITHILLFMRIFQKVGNSKSDYIIARQNLLNALENIDESLTNVKLNFKANINRLDEEYINPPKFFNLQHSPGNKYLLRQQSFNKNNSFISEVPVSESSSPSVLYLQPPSMQYEYKSNSKNISAGGSHRKISSNNINNHNNQQYLNQHSPQPRNTIKAQTFSQTTQQITRMGLTKSLNQIESYSECQNNEKEEKQVLFQTGNLDFKDNAHIKIPITKRYIKINPFVERTDYQADDDFLTSCID